MRLGQLLAQIGKPGIATVQPFQFVERVLGHLNVAPSQGCRRQIGVAVGDALETIARLGVARFAPKHAVVTVGGIAPLAAGQPVGSQVRGAFSQQDSDPVHGFGWRLCWRWRRCAGFAQLLANLIAQRQQPAVVGNLLQALIDVHQAGFVSANALRVQSPRQRLVGLRVASLGLGAQPSLLDLAVFLGQGLLAGLIFLGLAFLLFAAPRA